MIPTPAHLWDRHHRKRYPTGTEKFDQRYVHPGVTVDQFIGDLREQLYEFGFVEASTRDAVPGQMLGDVIFAINSQPDMHVTLSAPWSQRNGFRVGARKTVHHQ